MQTAQTSTLAPSAQEVDITSPVGRANIQKIKLMLLDRKSQSQIAFELGLSRENINRKIAKWMVTRDFEDWLKAAWLEMQSRVDDKTAHAALTAILCRLATRRTELVAEVSVNVAVTHTEEILRRYEVIVKGEKGNGIENQP